MYYDNREHNSSRKMHFFSFPIPKQKGPILTLLYIRSRSIQGHRLYNFVELAPKMLHSKFQGNRHSGSGEEDFFIVTTIYGHGGHLGYMPWTKYIKFLSHCA